jgi:T5SS/PEP-CTERM-associated repeat protein
MKTTIALDGTIANPGDIQPDILPLPDFTVLDAGIVPVALPRSFGAGHASPGPVAAAGIASPDAAAQSAFAATAAAGIASDGSAATTTAALLSAGSVVTGSLAYAPLVIDPLFGTSITSLTGTGGDPTTAAEVEGAIDAAIDYYETNWTSSVPIGTVINGSTISTVTVSIQFDYGTLAGVALTAGSGASDSHYGLVTVGNGSYSTVYSTLSGVLPNLPSTDPTKGTGVFLVTDAQSQILGLSTPGTAVAGYVGLNAIANGVTLDYNLADQSIAGEVGAVGAMEHEISEVFGRTADLGIIHANTYSILDLYRFTAPNTPALTAGASDYFSLNNGTTALGYFNNHPANGGDAGDWASSGTHNVVADAFDAFLTTGTAGTISSLDTLVLGAIGLRDVLVRTLVWTGAQGSSFSTAANWDDTTDARNPAQTAPGVADTAQFLSNGGTITGTGTAAALQFGGSVLWNVASGASLSALSGVTVGQSGTGALLVSGGASIDGLGASDVISGAAGGAASVTVEGTGSAWKSAGELTVGALGGGSLTIGGAAGVGAVATASAPAMVLGAGAGGNGVLSVTGAGSLATLVGGLDVGQAGTGALTVESQGTVITGGSTLAPAQGVDIAQASGGAGSITVFGTGALLSNTGGFVVGDAGVGGLAIDGGGSVVTTPGTVPGLAGLLIANTEGASGSSVNVSGGGSRLNVSGLLDIGVGGSGALLISGGATVTALSLDAGNSAAAVGQIGLSGTGTDLSVTNAATVADAGTGVLSVLSGATFSAVSLTIGSLGDSSGALVVSGSGSEVLLSGGLNIGTSLGTGDLTVGPGAAVHASVVNLQGQVVLEGGLLDPTVQLINQGQTAGGYGTIAAGDIVDEGVIQAGGTKPSQKLLLVQGTVLGGGTLTVNGTLPGSDTAGVLQINAGGTLELTGAVLNAATTTFTDDLTPTGTYTVNNSVIDVTFADATGVLSLDDIAGFAGTITTYQAGDSFVITGGTLSGLNVSNGNTLTIQDSGASAGAGGTDDIIFASPVSAAGFTIVNGDTVQVACFAAGTRIETATGLVAVEDMAVGDLVVTTDGHRATWTAAGPVADERQYEPVVWIGQREVNCARHPNPETVWPVRLRAGALGGAVPVRDLYLSPDHAVFVHGVLIPVKLLINGTSIAREPRDRVRYFHVELPRHAVIRAEGMPVESYLDTGDRANFNQDGATIRLFPEFASRLAPDAALLWETRGAAPLVLTGEKLAAARRMVANQPNPRVPLDPAEHGVQRARPAA